MPDLSKWLGYQLKDKPVSVCEQDDWSVLQSVDWLSGISTVSLKVKEKTVHFHLIWENGDNLHNYTTDPSVWLFIHCKHFKNHLAAVADKGTVRKFGLCGVGRSNLKWVFMQTVERFSPQGSVKSVQIYLCCVPQLHSLKSKRSVSVAVN